MQGLDSILSSLGLLHTSSHEGVSFCLCLFFALLVYVSLIQFLPIPCLFYIGSFYGFFLRYSRHCFSWLCHGFLALSFVAFECCFAVDRFSCRLTFTSGGKFGFMGFFWQYSSVLATSSPGYSAVIRFFWHFLICFRFLQRLIAIIV